MNYANRIGYSDIDPFEVVRRISDKTIEIREMDATLDPTWAPEAHIGGFCAHVSNNREQRWEIKSNPENKVRRVRLHKDGYWRDSGRNRFALSDTPRKFYDYNF
jgi:hypothetical protein